eukprot:355096-Chlamydomonas_euryale.AAC.9
MRCACVLTVRSRLSSCHPQCASATAVAARRRSRQPLGGRGGSQLLNALPGLNFDVRVPRPSCCRRVLSFAHGLTSPSRCYRWGACCTYRPLSGRAPVRLASALLPPPPRSDSPTT